MIGSTFKAELVRAGVTNFNFSWGSDGSLFFPDEYPEDQKTLVNTVLAAHVCTDLTIAIEQGERLVNMTAGAICAGTSTIGFGQDERYALKLAEAVAFQADTAPTEDSYPMIYGEVGITADTAAGVATAIIARAAVVTALKKNVEVYRKKAIAKVKACASAEDVATVLAGLSWPSA